MKQLDPEFRLQGGHPTTDRGALYSQLLGGGGKSLSVDHLGKETEQVEIHACSFSNKVARNEHLVPEAHGADATGMTTLKRMPAFYVPHGGGPFSYVEMGVAPEEVAALAGYWRTLANTLPAPPRALLVVSAHWETAVPTVMSSPQPPMLYDYYNFPPASYEIQWPAPGDPKLADRVRQLLEGQGFATEQDAERGFDHGTFIPLGRSFPNADVPTVQLSLKAGLDPIEHIALGRALTPLRDEGVLLIGSGMSYHNMQGFRSADADAHAERFDAWLGSAVQKTRAEREAALIAWTAAPSAREAHPREEHLLPLMVMAGAANEDVGTVPWRGPVFGKTVSAVHFG